MPAAQIFTDKRLWAKLSCLINGHALAPMKDWIFTHIGIVGRCSRCEEICEMKVRFK
jgi:hypothetical protein